MKGFLVFSIYAINIYKIQLSFIKINLLFTAFYQNLFLSTLKKDILMRKFVLPLLFLVSSVNAMDFGPNVGMEQEVYPKSLLVVNAQNLLEEAAVNLVDTRKLIELSYLSEKWEEADQEVRKYLKGLGYIQKETLQMVSLTVQGSSGTLSTHDLMILNSQYQTSVNDIMKTANEMPSQVFTILNLKNDKTEGNVVINSLVPIMSQLITTDLLTQGNAANANNILGTIVEGLASAQQDQNNNMKTIQLEKGKNLEAWEKQNQKLLKSFKGLKDYLEISEIIIKKNM